MGPADTRISATDNDEVTLRNVAFVSSAQPLAISFVNGRITDISESEGPTDWICLPPLIDKHVHANRAFTLADTKPESFEHSIALTLGLFRHFTAGDYAERAGCLFQRAFSHGTTGIRTHADIDEHTGLAAIQGSAEARKAMSEYMDIEIVAFASSRLDPAGEYCRQLLREAVALGADLLGAVPVFYDDPGRSIDALLELAAELEVAVDVHLDEHLNADRVWSEYLADALIHHGCEGRAALSHGCALSVLKAKSRRRIIDKLARAQVPVIVLPVTNLYLQDRMAGARTPVMRGLTCVHELLDAGIEVRFATDNVRDAFYPYGDADLLDTAYVAMLASQLDDAETLVKGICDGRTELSVGDAADLALIRGASFDELLSVRPSERLIIRHGVIYKSAERGQPAIGEFPSNA